MDDWLWDWTKYLRKGKGKFCALSSASQPKPEIPKHASPFVAWAHGRLLGQGTPRLTQGRALLVRSGQNSASPASETCSLSSGVKHRL